MEQKLKKTKKKSNKVYYKEIKTIIRVPKCPKCHHTVELPTNPDVKSIMTYHCPNCNYCE